ncbi:hypothetical protein OIU78_009563 [Salix suchowensis]|nr:hypothetical protein OIU78_009563 [Salix suchowensis]
MAEKELETNQEQMEEETTVENKLKGRKLSWRNLRRVDSLNLEAGRVSMSPGHGARTSKTNWQVTLSLVFQSIGVVYGDIGTSPLYVYSSTFTEGIHHDEDIVGVLSLIIYTIVLVPMLKYVFIVLWANDNGDGGTFALYSLICRSAKVGLIPKDQPEDHKLSNYRLDTPSNQLRRAEVIKEKMESSKSIKIILFLITILGTSMVIGDGVLTPCISVLSAVSGIKSLGQDAVVGISIAILIALFSVQRLGTDKVGFAFAPVIFLWFSFIGGIGLFNLFKYDLGVLRACNPKYIIDYFKRNGKQGWISLGGIVLCITGTEAMFADLGHFSVRAIQISFSSIVFPALVAAYSGQAAYLSKFKDDVSDTFYKSIPGIAVVAVMVITTGMVTLIMLVIWKARIWWIALFFFGFGAIEAVYLSSVLYKFKQGGYLPLAFSLFLMMTMGIWHYVQRERYIYELQNKVSSEYVRDLAARTDINRLPGIGLLYSELVQGIPPIFPHFISNIPSTHSVLVFVSIKSIPISKVAHEERFLFRHVEPREYRMFRCIVRYGYNDAIEEPHEFECQLVENLKEFIRHEHFISEGGDNESAPEADSIQHSTLLAVKNGKSKESSTVHVEESPQQPNPSCISSVSIQSINASSRSHQSLNGIKSANSSGGMIHASVPEDAEEEMQFVQKAMERGVFYLIGEAEVVSKPDSSWFNKLVVDYGYSFLRRNFRQGKTALAIPRNRLLRVGMTYEV